MLKVPFVLLKYMPFCTHVVLQHDNWLINIVINISYHAIFHLLQTNWSIIFENTWIIFENRDKKISEEEVDKWAFMEIPWWHKRKWLWPKSSINLIRRVRLLSSNEVQFFIIVNYVECRNDISSTTPKA